MTFSGTLFDLRRKMGLSQEDLANQIGVSRQTVSKWESGQSFPDAEKLMLLSETFSVSIDSLLKGDGEAPVAEVPRPKEHPMAADSVEKNGPKKQKGERRSRIHIILFLLTCLGNVVIYQASRYIKVDVPRVDHQGIYHWGGFKSVNYLAFLDKYHLEPVVLLLAAVMLWTGASLLRERLQRKKVAKKEAETK